jgi:hypothetical protein
MVVIGVIIRLWLTVILVAQVNWTNLFSTINFWQDVWDYLIHVCFMYQNESILEGSFNCCFNFASHYNSKYWIWILPMVFWSPYAWYFDPLPMVYRTPINGISNSTSIVYWTSYPRYLNPYPWYFGPSIHGILTPLPMVFRSPTHEMLTPLSMVLLSLYPWILNPYPWYVDPISVVFWPPTHGISNPVPMVFWPPIHGMLTHLPICWLSMRGFKIPCGFNLPHRWGSVFNKGFQYIMGENWPRGQNTMGVKIPYDTGNVGSGWFGL